MHCRSLFLRLLFILLLLGLLALGPVARVPSALARDTPLLRRRQRFDAQHLMNLTEGDHAECVLGAACNVLALLAAEVAGRVHRFLLARVQEARGVGQENTARKCLEYSSE